LGKATLWDIFGTLNPRAHTQKRVKFRTETAQKINLGHFVRPLHQEPIEYPLMHIQRHIR
jgi:hypothetical protein